MSAPEADLTGWSVAPFTGGGYTHDVYRRGEGPGVVLIPEIPGIHPGVLGLGNHLVDNGFTVAIPSLFGEPGRDKDRRLRHFDHRSGLCRKGIRSVGDQQAATGVGLLAGVGPRAEQGDTGQGRRGDRPVFHRRLRVGRRGRRQRAGAGAQPAVGAVSAHAAPATRSRRERFGAQRVQRSGRQRGAVRDRPAVQRGQDVTRRAIQHAQSNGSATRSR